jgi:hypothetical protein
MPVLLEGEGQATFAEAREGCIEFNCNWVRGQFSGRVQQWKDTALSDFRKKHGIASKNK